MAKNLLTDKIKIPPVTIIVQHTGGNLISLFRGSNYLVKLFLKSFFD